MSGYNDDDNVRNADERYYETLIEESENNMCKEEQFARILMQSEEEYERSLIASQIEEIEKNVKIKNEEIEEEKKRRTILCNPVSRYLYYSNIPIELLKSIREQLNNYKEMKIDKIEFESEIYGKFKNYVEVMKHTFGRYGTNIYEDINSILVCKI